MRFMLFLFLMSLIGCAEFDPDLVQDLPRTDDTDTDTDIEEPCEPACGVGASCTDATCACDEGLYGDPLVECSEIDIATGWIGSPCEDNQDCDYVDAFCLTESDGYPDGQCTQNCDLYCPDMDGMPVTFCIEPTSHSEGHCFSRCDYEIYPYTEGCRPEYSCVPWQRIGTTTAELTCVPSSWTEGEQCTNPLNFAGDDDCYLDAVAMGEPTQRQRAQALLTGLASPAEALDFLDDNYELSQDFIEAELGTTIHPNSSEGHLSDSPMQGAIVHYTAAQREDGTLRYFASSEPHASTHFVIGSYRNGLPVQIFSHQDRTWHAGSTFNKDRFGIDFANAGFLDPDEDHWQTYSGAHYEMMLPLYGSQPVEIIDGIPGSADKYGHKEFWQPYTYYQLLSYVMVMRALHLVYELDPEMIQRHGDVASSRVDPGPALPFTALNTLVFNEENVFEVPWLDEYKMDPAWIETHPDAR